MNTLQRTEKVSPLDKFAVLASDIDSLRDRMEEIRCGQSTENLTELVDLAGLHEQFGISILALRKKFNSVGAPVIKMGKRYCIRKVQYLRALEALEQQ